MDQLTIRQKSSNDGKPSFQKISIIFTKKTVVRPRHVIWGLQHTQTEWVVFTDPDDYLHPDYFKSVDTQISQHPSAVTVATNMKFFFENQNIIKDSHPLRFRFNKTHVIDVAKLDKFINMSAASTFFRVSHIKKQNFGV